MPDAENNLLAIPRKQRAMVRKGIKEGLRAEIDDDPDAPLSTCIPRACATWARRFSRKRYFAHAAGSLRRRLRHPDDRQATTTPSASVLNFYFRDEVLPYYGGGNVEARAVAGNDFMYWEVMERARERGCRIFDYGRSKRGTGAYDFKTYWGFEPEPLYYEYYLFKRKEMPNLSPTNPKFSKAIALVAQAATQVHTADRPADREVPGLNPPCAAFTASSVSAEHASRRRTYCGAWATPLCTAARTTQGAYADGELLLGMRRLSIIDVAGGHQPMASEDGTLVARLQRRNLQLPRAARELAARAGHRFTTGIAIARSIAARSTRNTATPS